MKTILSECCVDHEKSPFFLRDSRASETRARVKITPREKRRHAAGREKNEGLQTKPKLFTLLLKESHWMRFIDLKGDTNFTLQNQHVGRERSKASTLSEVPHFSLSPPRLEFLAWGDFHARSRFARSTIPEEKWGLLVV